MQWHRRGGATATASGTGTDSLTYPDPVRVARAAGGRAPKRASPWNGDPQEAWQDLSPPLRVSSLEPGGAAVPPSDGI